METMSSFVQKLKARYVVSSDYGMAKLLGLTRQAMSAHKNGRSKNFSESTAYRIAELLNMDPAYVIACLAAERSKDKRVAEAWRRIVELVRVNALRDYAPSK